MQILITCVFLLVSLSAPAATLTGQVVSVHDGDTLTVLDGARQQHKIRLLGIDAPELGQPYSRRARQALVTATMRQIVTIAWLKRDRYGRPLGKVLHHEEDLNLALLRAGLVWHYTQYADEQFAGDRERYAEAEKHARKARAGLWSDPVPIAPWNWRNRK